MKKEMSRICKFELTFFSGCVDCAWQLGVSSGSLGCDDNLSSILSRLKSNGLSDATASPRNVKGLASQFSAQFERNISFNSNDKHQRLLFMKRKVVLCTAGLPHIFQSNAKTPQGTLGKKGEWTQNVRSMFYQITKPLKLVCLGDFRLKQTIWPESCHNHGLEGLSFLTLSKGFGRTQNPYIQLAGCDWNCLT